MGLETGWGRFRPKDVYIFLTNTKVGESLFGCEFWGGGQNGPKGPPLNIDFVDFWVKVLVP